MWEDLDKEKAHMVVGFFETENIICASPGRACVRGGLWVAWNLVGTSLCWLVWRQPCLKVVRQPTAYLMEQQSRS